MMNEVLDFAEFSKTVEALPLPPEESWRPVLFRLGAGEDGRFVELCRRHRITLIDRLERQLAELAAARFPHQGCHAEREAFVGAALAQRATYGTWAYFPWEAKAVHLLDGCGYYEVVTGRNRDKIDAAEQLLLREKCVGVVGLSVGGEAAVTIAQEHLCGKIVLADFDRLDLSNLNRLGAGCDELGLPKATIIARRIARIDPYLEVSVYHEGVNESNAEQFLDGLDLLVEECDGLRMKYDLRVMSQARRLNVVYAADERGFLSVEPYGLRPETDLFHGLVRDRPRPREEYATLLDFMRALAEWLGGWGNISERSRGSLEQIGETLCGYPQLASEARYAAGQVGHAARRLLLGERLLPYVGNLDLAELVPAEAPLNPP